MENNGEALPTSLTGEERDEALRILRIIRPCLDGGVPLTRVTAEAGVSRWTLRRWIQRYRAQGLPGLCRQRRKDHGRRRLPEELQLLIEGLALQRTVRGFRGCAGRHKRLPVIKAGLSRAMPVCTRSCAVSIPGS